MAYCFVGATAVLLGAGWMPKTPNEPASAFELSDPLIAERNALSDELSVIENKWTTTYDALTDNPSLLSDSHIDDFDSHHAGL